MDFVQTDPDHGGIKTSHESRGVDRGVLFLGASDCLVTGEKQQFVEMLWALPDGELDRP